MGKFQKIGIALILFVILFASLVANAYYRWDQKIFAPIAYEVGLEMDWYAEKNVRLENLNVSDHAGLIKKLKRQGFRLEGPIGDNRYNYNGYHVNEGQLKWYVFDVKAETQIYRKEFSIAWGLCSQTVGVAIESNNNLSVRFLNPGGTCV